MTQHSSLLIETALEMMGEIGLEDLTLTAVAERAGVSRATVYREFGDKNSMISTVTRHEVGRMVTAGLQEIDLFAGVLDTIHTAVLFGIRYLRKHPVINKVRDQEPHWLLDFLIEDEGSELNLVETVGTYLTPILTARLDTAVLAVTPAQAAEIAARAALSHILIPRSGLTDEQVADYVVRAISRS